MRRLTLTLFLVTVLLSLLPVSAQDNASTIAKLVAARPELSMLSAAINVAKPVILETLDNPEANVTLFAPTDDAFKALAAVLPQADSTERFFLGKETLDAVMEDDALLTEVLLYHVIEGAMNWDDLLALLNQSYGDFNFFITLNGDVDNLSATFDSTGKIVMSEGIRVNVDAHIDLKVKAIEASNGVIYLIDRVMLPETRTIAEIIAQGASDKDYPEFTILTKILEAADPAILELLGDPDANVTLFAPLDAAFSDFTKEELASITGDREQATKFLNRYITSDLIYSFKLFPMLNADGILEIKMADASTATIHLPEERDYGEFYLNDMLISYTDNVAKNGLIQEFETAISPPGKE